MRFMFLNHSYVRHSPELEAHILKLLKSYASRTPHLSLLTPKISVADKCCPTPGCSAKPDSTKFDTDCAAASVPMMPGP